jgi:hypothetical protein
LAIIVKEAAYFEEVSKRFGATLESIKAGRRMVELVLEAREDLVRVDLVDQTITEGYRSWQRIKGPKFSVRTITESWTDPNGDAIILIHAVIPRDSNTYNEVEELWKQHRQRI